jgi:hypothetical protein
MDHRVKRLLIISAGLMLLCFTLTFAAEKKPAPAPLPPRVPEMSTAGKVVEISDKTLKIERTLKEKAETMEFFLEKPFANITVGDQLKVSYIEKNGQNVLLRVAPAKKTAVQKPKKETQKTAKPVAPPAPPVTK